MSDLLTLARPYARAIFARAKQRGDDFVWWENVLAVLATAVVNQKIKCWIANPKTTRKQQHQFLRELLSSLVDSCTEAADHLIQLLIEYRRLPVLPAIWQQYQQLVADEHHLLPMQITSAFALSAEQQQAVVAALSQRFQASVVPEFLVDKDLIGGICVRTRTWVMDASIKAQLTRLYHRLIR